VFIRSLDICGEGREKGPGPKNGTRNIGEGGSVDAFFLYRVAVFLKIYNAQTGLKQLFDNQIS
jgi:hypothetical protein